jgi:hypothetical protein
MMFYIFDAGPTQGVYRALVDSFEQQEFQRLLGTRKLGVGVGICRHSYFLHLIQGVWDQYCSS